MGPGKREQRNYGGHCWKIQQKAVGRLRDPAVGSFEVAGLSLLITQKIKMMILTSQCIGN